MSQVPQTLSDEEIAELCDKATSGPWHVDMPELGGRVFIGNRADGRTSGLWEIVHMSGDRLADLKPEAAERDVSDALFIAAARELVPALLARAQTAEATANRVWSLADVVAQLQRPDPDTHDRDVSWLALLAALNDED